MKIPWNIGKCICNVAKMVTQQHALLKEACQSQMTLKSGRKEVGMVDKEKIRNTKKRKSFLETIPYVKQSVVARRLLCQQK